MRRLLYRWHQWRHTRAKRDKDPTFRVGPAIAVIRQHATVIRDVLDVGPRNTIEVEMLEAFVGWHGRVDAIDLFPTSPRIRRGDMSGLPYADNAYDLVFLSHVLEHAQGLLRACREIGRVVRPGGYVWIETPRLFTPNAHDRHLIEEVETLVSLFVDFQPEVVWSEVLPHKLRALVRLRKEAPWGA